MSSLRVPTKRQFRGSNPSEGEIFRNRTDRPWDPPCLLYNGYRVFPGGKAPGAWHWPRTPSSAQVKERVQIYLYSLSGPSWPVLGWTLSLPLPFTQRQYRYVRGILPQYVWSRQPAINSSHEASQSVEECMNPPVSDYTESGDQSVFLYAEVTLNTMNETWKRRFPND